MDENHDPLRVFEIEMGQHWSNNQMDRSIVSFSRSRIATLTLLFREKKKEKKKRKTATIVFTGIIERAWVIGSDVYLSDCQTVWRIFTSETAIARQCSAFTAAFNNPVIPLESLIYVRPIMRERLSGRLFLRRIV